MTRRWPIRWHLAGLVAASVLPMILALGVALLALREHEFERSRTEVSAAAQRLGNLVEREMESYIAALQGLATSTAITQQEWARVDAHARDLARHHGSAISLRRIDGQQIVNTYVPWGSPLPVSTDPVLKDADQRTVATRTPTISDLYVGAVSKRLFVLAVVPVPLDGPPQYLLNIAVLPERLSELIAHGLPSSAVAVVVDSRNKIIARSSEIDSYVGRTSSTEQIAHMEPVSCSWQASRLDGTPVLAAHVTLKWGWKAVIAVPRASVRAPTEEAFQLLTAAAVLATGLALALSFRSARRLEREVRLLATPSRPFCGSGFRLAELHDVALELDGHERTRARARQAHEHLAAIVASSNDAIITIETHGTIISWNRGAENVFGYAAAEMVGNNIHRIVPEDQFEETEANFALAAAGHSYRIETTRRRKNGSLVEVAIRAAPIPDAEGKTAAISIVAFEITVQKRAERQRDLLLRELDHRLKNVFGTVSALVGLSARSARDVESYAKSLRQRIHALSEVHDLVRGTGLDNATSMSDIAKTISGGPADSQIRIDGGPDVSLSATAAIALGMILSELLTNAIKYGALSASEGHVILEWAVDETLRLTWSEERTTVLQPFGSSGFGWLMIEKNAASLGGEVQFAWRPQGLLFTLTCPLTSLDKQ